jgi:NADPH:quinone reductase-like Zn-dependent oxidoreductase
MQGYQLHAFGYAGLKLEGLPLPEPQPGELLLKVSAASLNYRDLLMLRGRYDPRQPLPLVPLSDCVGKVVEVGADVVDFSVGDRVCPIFAQDWLAGAPTKQLLRSTLGGPRPGTLREYMLVPERSVVRVPDSLSDVEAACLPCAGVTAYNALVSLGGARPGDVVLIQGSGGVSVFALQIAKALGARVIATSSSAAKRERLLELGAEHVIDYTTETRWGSKARSLAGGEGVDIVVEVGGSGTLDESLRAVKPGGTIAIIGVLSGGKGPVSLLPVLMQQVRLQGVMVGPRDCFEQLVRCVASANIHPLVDRVFAFDQARQAFEHLEAARHFGKVVIQVE